MSIAFVKLPGLSSERVLSLVEPVLRAHRVEGVELVWRSDRHGWLLELTIEHPDAKIPGQGITVDLCSEISRDLSAALDVTDLIGPRYRLEVGSPGVERALYRAEDYRRFSGQPAKIKLKRPFGAPPEPEADAAPESPVAGSEETPPAEGSPAEAPSLTDAIPKEGAKTPWDGQRVLRGTLAGVAEDGRVVLETDQGTLSLELSSVESARLVFDWQAAVRGGGRPKGSPDSGNKARGAKRSK
jgi:ribosome maturation factor RimP